MAKPFLAPIAGLAVVMLLGSCQDNGPILSIAITPSAATMASGDTLRFQATVRALARKEIAAPDVQWTTNDTAIAIDATGLATGRFTGAERTVVVTATTDNASASVPVLLKPCVRCGSWAQRAGLSMPRSNATVVALDGMVYAVGGAVGGSTGVGNSVAAVEMFDPATGNWSTRASLPGAQQGASGAALRGRVHVFGSVFGSDIARSYDPASDSWTELPPMPRVRIGGASSVLATDDARVYAFSPGLGIVDIYDPATNSWTLGTPTTPPIPFAVAGFVLAGKIYFFGNDAGIMYDPSIDAWEPRSPMPSGRAAAVGRVLHGKLYAVGGFGRPVSCGDFLCQGPRSNLVEIYDPATNTWASGSAIPILNEIAFADTIGGKLLVGVRENSATQLANLIYDAERDTWASRASMPSPDPALFFAPPRTLSVDGSVIAIFLRRRPESSAVIQFTP